MLRRTSEEKSTNKITVIVFGTCSEGLYDELSYPHGTGRFEKDHRHVSMIRHAIVPDSINHVEWKLVEMTPGKVKHRVKEPVKQILQEADVILFCPTPSKRVNYLDGIIKGFVAFQSQFKMPPMKAMQVVARDCRRKIDIEYAIATPLIVSSNHSHRATITDKDRQSFFAELHQNIQAHLSVKAKPLVVEEKKHIAHPIATGSIFSKTTATAAKKDFPITSSRFGCRA